MSEQRLKGFAKAKTATPFHASEQERHDNTLDIGQPITVIPHCLRQDTILNFGQVINVIPHLLRDLNKKRSRNKSGLTEFCHFEGATHVDMLTTLDILSMSLQGAKRRSIAKSLESVCHPEATAEGSQKVDETLKQVQGDKKFHTPHFTHCTHVTHSKKAAFTLAEVLITLGIIGVVAAMTIPTLIAKYQKKQILVQLKNSFSVVSNAIRLSEVDNGQMSIWPTGAEMDVNAYWSKYLKPYFANPVLCATKSDCGYDDDLDREKWSCGSRWGILTDDTRLLFRLKNGTIVFLPRNSHAQDGTPIYASQLYIDVNGASSPNECGKDVFMFIRTDKGIMPYSSPGKDCNTNPEFCADTIMKNGWEYPEDYPY